jgi:hypothetical protein
LSEFRLYADHELGGDDYPPEWHETIKHTVRAEADHRCVRCGHRFVTKSAALALGVDPSPGEWSPCDDQCSHGGEIRTWVLDGDGPDGEWYETTALWPVCDLLASSAATIEARYRVLTVHHLDGVKANCRWWNLAALCQRCHLEIQGKVVLDKPWPWPHTQWMRPYVAGFYALKYLDEDLPVRPAEDRIAELLEIGRREEAVERMAV